MTATIKSVKSATYYFTNIHHNYLTEGGDAPGKWVGIAVTALGLGKTVDKVAFQRILSGLHPTAEKFLVQIQRSKEDDSNLHQPGFDVTFLPPKSVSILWAVAGPATRKLIERAFDKAVQDAIDWLEANVPLTRRGKGGHIRELAQLVVASFDHVSNRNGEPLLHKHNVFCNVCQREDGTWGTLDSKTLHAWIRTLGPIMRANLAKQLRGIGIELEDATDAEGKMRGWFEVKGIPKSLIEAMSTRRAEIMAAIEGEGGTVRDSSAKARAKATLETRRNKEVNVARDAMHAQWRDQAEQYGFTEKKAEALLKEPQSIKQQNQFEIAWKEALQEITQTEAIFTERQLIQNVCERLQVGQFSGVEIADRVREELAHSKDIVHLQEKGPDQQFTTKEMWDLEAELRERVKTFQSRHGAQVSEKTIEKILAKNKNLDEEQVHAVRTLLSADSAIRSMSGVAGAGKSTTIRALKEGLEAEGYRVVGAALSGVAKEELAQKTGMPTRTIESYIRHLEKSTSEKREEAFDHWRNQVGRSVLKQNTWKRDVPRLDSKTVLFIDESSMVGTKQLNTLLKHAEKAGATVIPVGDKQQIQPVEAGMPMRHIEETSPNVHLATNRRQKLDLDKRAVQAIRDGKAEEAINNYAERGLVKVSENRREAFSQIVETWKQEGGIKRPEKIAIYTPTRREAEEVNRRCQEERLNAAKTPHILSASNGKERFYRGDRVIFHAPNRLYGGIENGFRGTVLSVDPIRSQVKVRLDQTPTKAVGGQKPSNIVTVPLKKFGEDISLGYACTTHKGQSQTVERALLLMSGKNVDRELAYVQATRAESLTKIFVDKAHAGEKLQDLIASVEKSRPKQNAHDHEKPQSVSPALRQERQP